MSKKIHPANAKIAQELLHKELFEKLNPVIKQGILSIWEKAVTFSDSVQYEGQPTLLIFQKFLQDIQDWNNLTVERETSRIKEEVRKKCIDDGEEIDDNWFEDIVGQIFISYAVIYESIKIKGTRPNIKLPVPDMNRLTHKIYIDLAEKIFREPYILQEAISLQERNEKDEKINDFIKETIVDVIRRTFPHSQIRKEYTGGVMENVKTAGDVLSSDEDSEPERSADVDDSDSDEDETESEFPSRTIELNPNIHKFSKSFSHLSPRSTQISSFNRPTSTSDEPSRNLSPRTTDSVPEAMPAAPTMLAPVPAAVSVPAPAPAPAPAPQPVGMLDPRGQPSMPAIQAPVMPGFVEESDTDTETDSD